VNIQIYGKSNCRYCEQAVAACEITNQTYTYALLGIDYDQNLLNVIAPKAKTFPIVLINDKYIGGFDQLIKAIA
jgi:glutaredoxin